MITIDLSPRPKKFPTLRWLVAVTAIGLLAAYQGHAVLEGRPALPSEFPAVFGFDVTMRPGYANSGFSASSRQACTGFLVHPKLILTAAHCLKDARSVYWAANGTEFSGRRSLRGTRVDVVEFGSHPDFVDQRPDSSHAEREKSARNDIGYLVLREPITEITPYELHVSADHPSIKKLQDLEATIVGYGVTEWRQDGQYALGRAGVKHTGSKPITELSLGYFRLDGEKSGGLPGDSGGPVLVTVEGELRVAGIDHGMTKGTKIVTNRRGKSRTVPAYGSMLATMLTPKHLCWVEKNSKVDLAAVNCDSDGRPLPSETN